MTRIVLLVLFLATEVLLFFALNVLVSTVSSPFEAALRDGALAFSIRFLTFHVVLEAILVFLVLLTSNASFFRVLSVVLFAYVISWLWYDAAWFINSGGFLGLFGLQLADGLIGQGLLLILSSTGAWWLVFVWWVDSDTNRSSQNNGNTAQTRT